MIPSRCSSFSAKTSTPQKPIIVGKISKTPNKAMKPQVVPTSKSIKKSLSPSPSTSSSSKKETTSASASKKPTRSQNVTRTLNVDDQENQESLERALVDEADDHGQVVNVEIDDQIQVAAGDETTKLSDDDHKKHVGDGHVVVEDEKLIKSSDISTVTSEDLGVNQNLETEETMEEITKQMFNKMALKERITAMFKLRATSMRITQRKRAW